MSILNIKLFAKFYTPAFFSGVALIFCFPNFDIFYLAWVILVPFLISLYEMDNRKSFKAGIIFGFPYFFGTLYWIYHSINHYGNIPFLISIIIVFMLCAYLCLYTGIFAMLFSVCIRNTKLPALFIAPLFWTVIEFLRSYILTGFPWSSIGYSQYKFLPVIQIADITGIYGISFLVLLYNGALADIFLLKKRTKKMPLFPLSHSVIGFTVLVILTILIFIYGHIRLNENRHGKFFKASVIQGNIEQDKKWDSAYQHLVIETYKEMSIRASLSSPSIIIWPETALPFFFNTDEEYTYELIDFQKQLNTHLLFGSILIKGKDKEKYLLSNSAVLLDPYGKVTYIYDKIHLVPFGEYVPLQKILFFINKLVVGIGDYIKGNRYILAETPYGYFSTVICYEVIFPGLVRKFFLQGGDFLVNITNDAWFGQTTGPYQHFSMSTFRAIENRKPVIRVANTGISGFIDSNGRILSKTGIFERTFITENIRTDSTLSFYTKYGDLFTYICIILTVLLLTNVFSKYRK